jgi:hypothetical protein
MRTELSTREQGRRAAADDGDRRGGSRREPVMPGRASQAGRSAPGGRPTQAAQAASAGRPGRAEQAAAQASSARQPGRAEQAARAKRPARADQAQRSDRAQRAVSALRAEEAGGSGPQGGGGTATLTRPSAPPRRRSRPPGRVSPPPRPASPRPAAVPAATRAAVGAAARAGAARRLGVPRTPFVLLVLGLLGGGLVCLLVINTTLGSASYKINNLQQGNTTMSQEVQALQNQVATEQAPATIARKARKLGLRQEQVLTYLNASTGRISRQPILRNVPPAPGFTP